MHTVLTGYDMMILRAYYDPALRSGMTRAQVADRLPGILARVNPAGQGLPAQRLARTPRVWIEAIQTALGPGFSASERRAAAQEALKVASAMGWTDHRRGFSHYALGRVLQGTDPARAQDHFARADSYFATGPQSELHRAYAASQLAAGLGERFGPERVVNWAVTGFVAFSLLLVALVWAGIDAFALLVALLIAGLIYPLFGHWAWADGFHSGNPGWLATTRRR